MAAVRYFSQPLSVFGSIKRSVSGLTVHKTNPVVRSGALVALIAGICRFASAGKEMLVASRLGTSDETDIFLLAFLLPSIITNVITGSLGVAVIPQIVSARKNGGSARVHQLYSSILIGSCAATLLVVANLAIAAPLMVAKLAGTFSLAKTHSTVNACLILLPMCSIVALTQLWSALLSADRKFLIPSIVPCATTVVVMIAASRLTSRVGAAQQLAYATLIGSVVEAVIIGVSLRRSGFNLIPRFGTFDSRSWIVAREFFFVSIASVMDGVVTSLNQSAAAGLGSGSVAALNYGTRLITVMATICSIAAGTVLLPHFSEIAATEDWKRLERSARKYAIGSFSVLFVLMLAIIYFAEPTIQMLFERGTFTHSDTQRVARIHAASTLRLPFMVPSLIGARLLITLRATNRLLLVTVLNVTVTVILVPLLSRTYGLPGIAFSTAAMYCLCTVSMFALASHLFRSKLGVPYGQLAEGA